jgi:Zn-dependent protease/predicted transcriptional regulator
MRTGFRIGRLFGIDVRIDWGLFLVFWLVTFNLGAGLFPRWHPEWNFLLTWSVAVASAVLFFASVLAHELSHALVARANGIPVRDITLLIFGGVTSLEREPPSPRSEFFMAVVGPLTSFAIGLVAWLIGGAFLGRAVDLSASPELALRKVGPIATLLLWLGPINMMLGAFNLIPGFPLDGGRVLRATLWALLGDLRAATRYASGAGRVVGWLFIFVGISMMFGVHVPFFGTGFINGLWIAFIGWFLNNAAMASYQQVVVRDVLQGVPVAAVMRTGTSTVDPNLSVEALVEQYFMGTDQRAFPVVVGDQLVGIVCLQDLRRVPREHWQEARVHQIMTPASELTVAAPGEQTSEALQKLSARDVEQIPVVEGGRLRGVLRRRDILRWLEIHQFAQAPA